MLPMATGGTRIGRISSVRIQRLPRTPATAIASASPNTISITTETATNTNVLMIAGRDTHPHEIQQRIERQRAEQEHGRQQAPVAEAAIECRRDHGASLIPEVEVEMGSELFFRITPSGCRMHDSGKTTPTPFPGGKTTPTPFPVIRAAAAPLGCAAVLAEQLDFLRRRVERLAGAHLADQRLLEPQSQDLLDLRALGITQFLLRELLRLEIRRHPAQPRFLRQIGREHVTAIRDAACLRKRALRVVGQEPARERKRRLLLRIRRVLRNDGIPVADHGAASAAAPARQRHRLELAGNGRLVRIFEARESCGHDIAERSLARRARSWMTSP